jgi:6-phospho-beta-glucosidase
MSQAPPFVITIVGGGAYTPRLCEALASTVDLPELSLRLWARRQHRLEAIAAHSARRVTALRPAWSVQAASSRRHALEGGTIVVLLVRVGGLAARAWDEEFPQRFGLVGDEGLGPGGIANAWRTLPELTAIAEDIGRVAPAARILNLMAPLGITTRLLLDQGLDAIGLCELPLLTLEAWLARAGNPDPRPSWRYGGLNHLGWFWEVPNGGRDLLPVLADTPAQSGNMAPVDKPTLENYGAAPLRYFYDVFDPDAARRLRLVRRRGRARQLLELSENLIRQFAEKPGHEIPEADARPTPWLDRVVAPVASAFLGGPAHLGFANVRNEDNIPELPPEVVVEVAATLTTSGVAPVKPGPLPHEVAGFLCRAAEAERLTYLAAVRRDVDLLKEAIRALPLAIPESAVVELAALARSHNLALEQERR